MQGLDGKVAFVTGAVRAPGMGRALALRLAREGADVVCTDITPTDDASGNSDAVAPGALDALTTEIRSLGRRSLAFELDPTDATAIQTTVDASVNELGTVDMCCHFGGATGPHFASGRLLSIDEVAWDRCIDTNLISAWLVARTCAAAMVRRGEGGSLVLLSSFAARSTPEGYGAFSAARAGVLRLVEVLALELAPSGVRANAILPLGVAPEYGPNPGLDELAGRDASGVDAWVRRNIPLGRLQTADEVASVAAFLCSDDASFVTGQAVPISGGALR